MNKQPKLKICRRLGSAVFPKCENPRVAESISSGRVKQKRGRGGRSLSEYGNQLLEKQRARYTYNLRERQFARYAREAASKKGGMPMLRLYQALESRIDNVVFRLGFTKTRAAARQMVSHGHITVNGKKITIPSRPMRPGDVVGIRSGSANKTFFNDLAERLKEHAPPSWLSVDEKREGNVLKEPSPDSTSGEAMNLASVLEFYGR